MIKLSFFGTLSFSMYIDLCNHHHNQDTEQFYYTDTEQFYYTKKNLPLSHYSHIISALLTPGIHVCMFSLSVLSDSLQTLDCGLPGSSVLLPFWQKYWSGLQFPPPGDLPDPGIKSTSPVTPALAGRFFTTEPQERPLTPDNH